MDIPTPTKQRNMHNPSQGSINLKGTIENGDTNGRFIDNETIDGAISGNGTVQNGRARNHSVSEIIQNDAITTKAHSGVSKKRPGTMASPGGASERAKLMSPRESDQLKDKIEAARKIQEAKARRVQTQALRAEAEARLVAYRKKQLVLMNAQLEEEMRLEGEAEERLVREEDSDDEDEEDEEA